MPAPIFEPSAWPSVRLVVFDVDGTLYHQRRLRVRMARDLLLHALSRRSLEVLTVLRRFRRIREQLGEQQTADFGRALLDRTAAATGQPPAAVEAFVAEWMEHRPLRYLGACCYPGLPALFAGLRRTGKVIGVLSDYPANAKLAAMGLEADHVVCAGDPDIGVLKPHPRGLQFLMATVGVQPSETMLVGDRPERDGLAARAVGAWPLIRADKPVPGWQTFTRFDDPVFAPVLQSA